MFCAKWEADSRIRHRSSSIRWCRESLGNIHNLDFLLEEEKAKKPMGASTFEPCFLLSHAILVACLPPSFHKCRRVPLCL